MEPATETEMTAVLTQRVRFFGQRLAHHRKGMGLTLEQLAERAGLSTGYLGNLEKAFQRRPASPTVPSDETLEKLAGALGTTFYEVNSWLDRGPTDFDPALWSELLGAGVRSGLPDRVRRQIVESARSAVEAFELSRISQAVRAADDVGEGEKKC